MNINPNRPIEKLVGDNYGITRQIVNRCHVGLSLLQVAREARPTNMRKAPPKLRRGLGLMRYGNPFCKPRFILSGCQRL